jgi:hypothetical protein
MNRGPNPRTACHPACVAEASDAFGHLWRHQLPCPRAPLPTPARRSGFGHAGRERRHILSGETLPAVQKMRGGPVRATAPITRAFSPFGTTRTGGYTLLLLQRSHNPG